MIKYRNHQTSTYQVPPKDRFYRVYVWGIALKIPSQKTLLENLTCDFPDDCSILFLRTDHPIQIGEIGILTLFLAKFDQAYQI